MNSFFSMNSFDILFWTICILSHHSLCKERWKEILVFAWNCSRIGIAQQDQRALARDRICCRLVVYTSTQTLVARRIWFAAATAFFLFLPHFIWQVNYNFPTIEFIKNATLHKYIAISPMKMFLEQVMNMNPSSFPLWFAGVIYFLIAKSTRQFRILPLIYLTVFIILVINRNSKSEYMGPMFPMLFALGAYSFETFLVKMNWRWLKPVMLILLLPFSIISTPFALAVLPVESFISYSQTLYETIDAREETTSSLPHFYADMFGWEKMAAAVSDAYNHSLLMKKLKCAVICNNYGEAGAIDFFGPKYHLPKAISGHNNYWLWVQEMRQAKLSYE